MIRLISMIRAVVNRHPMAAAFATVGAYLAVFGFFHVLSAGPDIGPVLITPERVIATFWPELWLALSVITLVALFGWGRETRLTTPLAPRSARIMILPLLLVIGLLATGEYLSATTGVRPTLMQGLLFARTMICVGLFEEILFRGILLYGLQARFGPVRAALASSLFFGLFHYSNWLSGQDLTISHFQVLHATSMGVMMAAITLRTGSLWPAIGLHSVWNLVAALNIARGIPLQEAAGTPGAGELAPGLGLMAVEMAIGLGILALWARQRRRAAASA